MKRSYPVDAQDKYLVIPRFLILTDLTPNERMVAAEIYRRTENGSQQVYIRSRYISENTGVDKNQVTKAMRKLADLGYIKFDRTFRGVNLLWLLTPVFDLVRHQNDAYKDIETMPSKTSKRCRQRHQNDAYKDIETMSSMSYIDTNKATKEGDYNASPTSDNMKEMETTVAALPTIKPRPNYSAEIMSLISTRFHESETQILARAQIQQIPEDHLHAALIKCPEGKKWQYLMAIAAAITPEEIKKTLHPEQVEIKVNGKTLVKDKLNAGKLVEKARPLENGAHKTIADIYVERGQAYRLPDGSVKMYDQFVEQSAAGSSQRVANASTIKPTTTTTATQHTQNSDLSDSDKSRRQDMRQKTEQVNVTRFVKINDIDADSDQRQKALAHQKRIDDFKKRKNIS